MRGASGTKAAGLGENWTRGHVIISLTGADKFDVSLFHWTTTRMGTEWLSGVLNGLNSSGPGDINIPGTPPTRKYLRLVQVWLLT